MNAQYTPGPWVIDGSVNAENLDVINSEGRIAMIDDSRSTGWNVPTINANARLIAAAPDLLAALIECERIANELFQETGLHEYMHASDRAREAIAKATGGAA
jgi:hypothetical protein